MKLLIVVDMQNDFIDGALGTREAEAIVANVQEKIAKYKKDGDKIIFTRDTHQADYLQTSEGKKLPVEHCIEHTKGWQIAGEVEDVECIHINKPNFGWLGWTDMDMEGIESIELVGLCTDICVVSNALILKAAYPDMPIFVDADCCAGVTPKSHEAALLTMKMCQIDILNEK